MARMRIRKFIRADVLYNFIAVDVPRFFTDVALSVQEKEGYQISTSRLQSGKVGHCGVSNRKGLAAL